MSSRFIDNIDVYLSPLINDLKKKWSFIIGILFVLCVLFILGIVLIYKNFGMFESGGENTITDKIWVIYSVLGIVGIVMVFHYSTFLFGEKVIKKLFGSLSSNLTYTIDFKLLGITYGDDLGWDALSEKLGFGGGREYIVREDTMKYEQQGKSCEAVEIMVYNTVGSGRYSSQILLQHGLFFRCLFDKKISTQDEINCFFDTEAYGAMKKAMRKEKGQMSGIPVVVLSVIFFIIFFLILFGVYGVQTLIIILAGGILLIVLLFLYFSTKQETTLNKQFFDQYEKIKLSQKLPTHFQTLNAQVFQNNALFMEDNQYTYIFYPLQHDFFSAQLWHSSTKIKQKIRKDLQLFFGVIEWMEKLK